MADEQPIAPGTKPGPGAPPHEWRNRNYGDAEETRKPRKYLWLKIVAAAMSLCMMGGMLWSGVISPLLK